MPVAGGKVVHLLRERFVKQAVLQKRAGGTGRPLRAQGQRIATLVGKGVHLLLDNVGRAAHTALKQIGLLEHRGTHLAVAIGLSHLAHGLLHVLRLIAVLRQQILRAFDRFCNKPHKRNILCILNHLNPLHCTTNQIK